MVLIWFRLLFTELGVNNFLDFSFQRRLFTWKAQIIISKYLHFVAQAQRRSCRNRCRIGSFEIRTHSCHFVQIFGLFTDNVRSKNRKSPARSCQARSFVCFITSDNCAPHTASHSNCWQSQKKVTPRSISRGKYACWVQGAVPKVLSAVPLHSVMLSVGGSHTPRWTALNSYIAHLASNAGNVWNRGVYSFQQSTSRLVT